MSQNQRISFLPIWGKQNETIPIQQMRALQDLGVEARYGKPGAIFPLTKTALSQKSELISLDWIHQYCLAPGLSASLIKSFLFALDVFFVEKILRVKLVWTLHNLRHHDPRPRKLERWISRYFASHCQKIRLLGRGMEDEISRYLSVPLSKLEIIPEGPYIGWYPEGIGQEEARQKLNLPSKSIVWLYLGNLRPYKGVEDLISGFQKLDLPQVELLIAGNPWNKNYAQSLTELAKNNPKIHLHFHTIPDDTLQVFFAAADLVVLPFKNVLNSGSALLAMGFSKAVVAPAMGLLPFRLASQVHLLYPPGEGLEAGLKTASQLSQSQLKAIGAQNRVDALKYKWSDFAQFLIYV